MIGYLARCWLRVSVSWAFGYRSAISALEVTAAAVSAKRGYIDLLCVHDSVATAG